MQLVDSIPVSWKSEIKKNDNSPIDLSNSEYTVYLQSATTVENLQLTCKGFYEKLIIVCNDGKFLCNKSPVFPHSEEVVLLHLLGAMNVM